MRGHRRFIKIYPERLLLTRALARRESKPFLEDRGLEGYIMTSPYSLLDGNHWEPRSCAIHWSKYVHARVQKGSQKRVRKWFQKRVKKWSHSRDHFLSPIKIVHRQVLATPDDVKKWSHIWVPEVM